ncbi:hypothetical protein [Streptomyces sp. NPDC102462]|uniref:hypothetical protein n=1 Tax=Streptomyces sp. NPDC102462 TaxID=3366178 RepID=UPI00380000DE
MANPTTFGPALCRAAGAASCVVPGSGLSGAAGARGLDTTAPPRCWAAGSRGLWRDLTLPRGLPMSRGLSAARDGAVPARVCRSGDPVRRLERLIARLVPEPGVRDAYRHPDHGPLGTAREAAA